MKILTYWSFDAPDARAWVAYWQVPIRPKKPGRTTEAVEEIIPDGKGEKIVEVSHAVEGIMPYSFFGPSEAAVIAMAQAEWDKSWGKKRLVTDGL